MLKLDEKLYVKLRQAAFQNRKSMAEIVRKSIQNTLGK